MRNLLMIFLALCVLFVIAHASFAADETTVKGYVADSKCAAIKNEADPKTANSVARHQNATAERLKKYGECNRRCIKEGAKMVVVTDDDKVLTIENPQKLQGREAQHVQVTGYMIGTSLHVESVKAL
jgi:putative cell wall-binding protein